MPTLVKFSSGENLTLNESFDRVHQELGRQNPSLFTVGEGGKRTTVFAANINFIQEIEENEESLVASA